MNIELWQNAFATLKANKRMVIILPADSTGNELGGAVALRSHIIEQSKNVQDVFIVGMRRNKKYDFMYVVDEISEQDFKNSQKIVMGTSDVSKLDTYPFEIEKTIFFSNEEVADALISVHAPVVSMGELVWEFSATEKDAQIAHSYKDATFVSIIDATNFLEKNTSDRTKDIYKKCSLNAFWIVEQLEKTN